MKYVFSLLGVIALGGCANPQSIYRPIELGSATTAQAVTTDIKQRVIISSPRARVFEKRNSSHSTGVIEEMVNGKYTDVVFCPEPLPEALSAYGSSTGISANRGATAAGQIAIGSAEAAGFVGLRTQSIQLLREDKFSICLAYLNNGITTGEYYDLQRRNQIFTLGILAIEQLTGTVKADQVALGTGAGAGGGSDSTEKEAENLDKAKKELNEAITSLDKQRAALDTARSQVPTLINRVAAADKKLRALPSNADEATKTEAQSSVDSAMTELATKRKEVEGMEIDLASLQRSVSNANSNVASAQTSLNLALSRVRATASGEAAFNRSGGISTAMAEHISNATVQIVKAVIRESGRGEQCNALLASIRRRLSERDMINSGSSWAQAVAAVCPNAEEIKSNETDPTLKQVLEEAARIQNKPPTK